MTVLKKIRKAGEMNGYAIDLAEAQAKDYVMLKNEVKNIKEDVAAIKTEQAVQGGKIDLILQRLNGPVEKERKDGIFWAQLKAIGSTWLGKFLIILMLCCIALAGDKILQLLGAIPNG